MTEIFVFGSNREGKHGAGAALYARRHRGAVYGVGEGFQGESYALPTKQGPWASLALEDVAVHVATFMQFAWSRPDLTFRVTPVGCGLAGFKRSEIEPLFAGMPDNCFFSPEWEDHNT